MQNQAGDITGLLVSWREGNRAALDTLLPLIQRELNQIARRHLGRERRHPAMQPSSLVQEAYVRLLHDHDVGWRNRAHFFAIAARVMRQVLVDHARQRSRAKRGGEALHIPLELTDVLSPDEVEEVVAVDLALERLAALDERKSQVLELRFFGGLSLDETAEVLGVAQNTVIRDWNFARAWLRRELSGKETANHGTLATD